MLDYPQKSDPRLSKTQGFTLIELLVVIAIIMILAGITFGVSRGVQNAQARAKAKADLAAISQALEQFKGEYGDYPWTSNEPGANIQNDGERLLAALDGIMEWSRDNDGKVVDLKLRSSTEISHKKSYIDVSKLSLNKDLADGYAWLNSGYWPVDPWGNAYVYTYAKNKSTTWENFGYVLYSRGPDGDHASVTGDGILTPDLREDSKNIDNIYAGE